MLRTLVLTLGFVAFAAGVLLVGVGSRGSGLYLMFIGAAVILGTAFERWRYRSTPPAGARWERTSECFEDPATGEMLEVQYDPASGARRYVRTSDGASSK